jgi:hypothetical protein
MPSGVLFGSAGPGYGVPNGLVGPPSGDAQVALDAAFGLGTCGGAFGSIDQTISGLVSGQTYSLSFWQAGSEEFVRGTEPEIEFFTASLGDQGVASPPTMDVSPQGFAPWEEYSTTFTWDGSGNSLQISATAIGNEIQTTEPAFVLLADVSLTAIVAIPEPSTWAMVIAGFAGLGYLAIGDPSASQVKTRVCKSPIYEAAARNLIGKELGVRFEAFCAGPDGGTDGRLRRAARSSCRQSSARRAAQETAAA